MTVEATLILCRFLRDASALSLWGAFAYLAILMPPDLSQGIDERLARFRVGAGLLVLAMTGALLPLQAGAIGNGWPDVLAIQTLRDVAFETSVGHTWQIQVAAAAALLVAVLMRRGRVRIQAVAAASGFCLATLALGGHAAMRSGMLGALQRLNDAVHLLAAGAWLGALLPLVVVLAQSRSTGKTRAMCVTALWRFSRAGRVAVVAVLLTGTANTALVVGQWPTDMTSTYQQLLSFKILLVIVMVTLAVVNRYVIVPRLPTRSQHALRAIRLNSIVEIGIGLIVVCLVAAFGTLDPR